MIDKKLIKTINEEISKFDFLGNDEYGEDEKDNKLIENEDFQKQFIIDSITKPSKIKEKPTDVYLSGNWEGSDSGEIGIEYITDLSYTTEKNKEPIQFTLAFEGNNIGFSTKTNNAPGDNTTPAINDRFFDYINWLNIEVNLYDKDGSTIDFVAFKKAPPKLKTIFIRSYIEPMIINKTNQEIEQSNDSINENVPS